MCVCVCLCVCECVKHCLCATYVSVFLPAVTQPETIIFSVELHRNGQNLGITLTGAYLHIHWHPMLSSSGGQLIALSILQALGITLATPSLSPISKKVELLTSECYYDNNMIIRYTHEGHVTSAKVTWCVT